MLESIKVRSRLALIVIAASIGFIAIATASVFTLRQTMLEDRKTKTQHLVEIAIGILEGCHA